MPGAERHALHPQEGAFCPARLSGGMMDIREFLAVNGIPCERYDHEPVYTCEQADRLPIPGVSAKTKNLFLRDRKGRRHILRC